MEPAVAKAIAALRSDIDIDEYSDKGANGHLFFGTDRILRRRLAIKFYPWEDDRAHEEPRRLSTIDSDHVLKVLSARVVDDDWAMFVTPYCPKGDLERVVASATLSLHAAIDQGIEVLTGVSALHGARLVHRDLKPANIFIDEHGKALIGDFGSVRAVPDHAVDVPGSGHSALYRPPESFANGRYSFAGDVYQCGMVMYQLAGGVLSYDGEDWLDREGRRRFSEASDDFEKTQCVNGAIERRAARAQLLDLSTLPPTVPARLKRAITRATHPDPRRRFAACSEFIGTLRAVRHASMDWLWKGDHPVARADHRTIRIVRNRGGYVPESDKGEGWRRVNRFFGTDLEAVIREVESHYG